RSRPHDGPLDRSPGHRPFRAVGAPAPSVRLGHRRARAPRDGAPRGLPELHVHLRAELRWAVAHRVHPYDCPGSSLTRRVRLWTLRAPTALLRARRALVEGRHRRMDTVRARVAVALALAVFRLRRLRAVDLQTLHIAT